MEWAKPEKLANGWESKEDQKEPFNIGKIVLKEEFFFCVAGVIVYPENDGTELEIFYVGKNAEKAKNAFLIESRAEYIEVWKNDEYYERIYNANEFSIKYENK